MPNNDIAIEIQHVSKTYLLFKSNWDRFRDVFGIGKKVEAQEFFALKDVSMKIRRGERVALVGRNGAGKTTLLKLMTQNFTPSSGRVVINGTVQALINTGLGFHPEFTGRENIRSSLKYNGLSDKQLEKAMEEIIDFVELGDFIDQPLKVYSMGMQSRLQFATATAIHPDILIIDEVLGAGDAYFSAKCADRMEKLTKSGCTLVLVSHATSQVLQFCETAYWLECGSVVLEGKALDVVKAYEEYSKKLEHEAFLRQEEAHKALELDKKLKKNSVIQSKWLREKLLQQVLEQHQRGDDSLENNPTRQIMSQISRWPRTAEGLLIEHLSVLDQRGEICFSAKTGDALTIQFQILCEEEGEYPCVFVILIFTEDGRWVTRHCSPSQELRLLKGQHYTFCLRYEELLLGNGKYVFSAALYKELDLGHLSTASYYDLLSRSFEFEVKNKYPDDSSLICHPGTWLTEATATSPAEDISTSSNRVEEEL